MSRLLLIVLAVALAASGCSGTGGSPSADDDLAGSPERPPSAAGDDTTEQAPKESRPVGDRLRLALVAPRSYRPAEVVLTDQAAVIVSDLVYDGLTEAVGREQELRPGLATSWIPDDEFRTWTFTLDPDAGVTARQVVAELAPLSLGGVRTTRSRAAAVVAGGIESVAADGDSTVVVRLAAPNAGLPWVLSGLPYSIEGPDGASTGDYEVTSDDSNGMILRRRRAMGSGGQPTEIQISWTSTAAEAYDLVVEGEVDGAVVDSESFDAAGETLDAEVLATAATRFYVLNSRSESLADPEVRRAVLASFDRVELVDGGFGQQVIEVDGLLAPALTGYTDSVVCGSVCNHNPQAAADVVSQMPPPRLQVTFAGDDQEALAVAMVEQLVSVGFDAEQRRLEPDDLASLIVTGETDLFGFGWVAPATSSDAVIPPLLSIDSAANIARIDSPEVSDLLEQAAVTADDRLRWRILSEAHQTALAEALIVPVAASTSMFVQDPGLQPLAIRADGSIDLDWRT